MQKARLRSCLACSLPGPGRSADGDAPWPGTGRALVALFLLDLLPPSAVLGHCPGPQRTPQYVQARLDALPEGPLAPPPDLMGQSQIPEQLCHLQEHLWSLGPPTMHLDLTFWLKDHLALGTEHPEPLLAMKAVPFLYLVVDTRSCLATILPGHGAPARGGGACIIGKRWVPRHPVRRAWNDHLNPSTCPFRVSTWCPAPCFLLVQQNHLPGWEVLVDSASAPVHQVNVAAFGWWSPPGSRCGGPYVDPP